jgi:hypothetical protein
MCYTRTWFWISNTIRPVSSDESEWGPAFERIETSEIASKKPLDIDPEMVDAFKKLMDWKRQEVSDLILSTQ